MMPFRLDRVQNMVYKGIGSVMRRRAEFVVKRGIDENYCTERKSPEGMEYGQTALIWAASVRPESAPRMRRISLWIWPTPGRSAGNSAICGSHDAPLRIEPRRLNNEGWQHEKVVGLFLSAFYSSDFLKFCLIMIPICVIK